jgi:hypothetical protein
MGNSSLVKRLISIPDHQGTRWQIISWWELRRLPYNLIVGLGGALGLLLFVQLNKLPPMLASPPTVHLLPVILFGTGANFFYTAGWVAELIARDLWPEKAPRLGPQLLLTGSLLSVMLALFPALAAFVVWVWRAAAA